MVARPRAALILTLLYAAALFWINHIDLGDSPLVIPGSDKLAHFTVYAGLAFLLGWSCFPERRRTWRGMVGVMLLIAGYGVVDEVGQNFVPHRTCDLYDWFADVVGGMFGLLAHLTWMWLAASWRRQRRGPKPDRRGDSAAAVATPR